MEFESDNVNVEQTFDNLSSIVLLVWNHDSKGKQVE